MKCHVSGVDHWKLNTEIGSLAILGNTRDAADRYSVTLAAVREHV